MNKVTSIALAGVLALAVAAKATEVRQAGLGKSATFVADNNDQTTLPTSILANGNIVELDFNASVLNDKDNMGGAQLNLGPGVLSVWGNRPYTRLSLIDTGWTQPNQSGAGGVFTTTVLAAGNKWCPSQTIDLGYAFKINDMGIAIGINRAASGSKVETVTTATTTLDENANDFGINLGFSMGEMVVAGIQWGALSVSRKFTTAAATDENTAAGSHIGLRVAGAVGPESGQHKYNVAFSTDSLTLKANPNGGPNTALLTESKNTGMGYSVGYAHAMNSDKGMGLAGLTIEGSSQSRDQGIATAVATVNKWDNSNIGINLVSGGEAKVKEWLVLRGGVSSTLWGQSVNIVETGASGATTKVTTTDQTAAKTALTLGVSLILGSVTIDGLFTDGNQAAGGLDGAMFSRVSATFAWGGAKD